MIEEQRRILNMTAEGKLTASEAEALLDAISRDQETRSLSTDTGPHATSAPKFLRVLVDGEENEKPNKVNVRIPLDLIRAGMRLAALLPAVAHGPIERALKESGMDIDISKLKTEDLEGLVAHLRYLQVDVDQGTDHVRVFCE